MQPQCKRPLLAWRHFQQRRASADQIGRSFQRWPDANVGTVTCRVSGIVVVDVDLRHGGRKASPPPSPRKRRLPATVEASTGGGGRHLYYVRPGTTVANRVAPRPDLDLRGDGGCVVAPPSVHPSGRRYAWADGRAPRIRGGHAREHWRTLIRDEIVEGRRHDTLATPTGHLRRREVDVDLGLMLAWNQAQCRPPLPNDEVARVVQSIARVHARGSSASP